MFLDAQNEFSSNQAVTAQAISTNVIDTSVARDLSTGEKLTIQLTVTETMDDTGDNSTLAVELVTDDNAAMSSPTVVRTLVTLAANTVAGTQLFFHLDPEQVQYERYVALRYTPANGDLSAGKFTAGFVRDIQKANEYPRSGFKVI